MEMHKILIIEDDDAIRMALEDDFAYEGYEVLTARTGKAGLEKGMDQSINVILLDVMLPEISGFDICKTLRKRNIPTPIIMLTAKGQEIDKVLGLEFGADDYVTKPYSSRELHARVKAQLRRSSMGAGANGEAHGTYSFGNININFDAHELTLDDNRVALTPYEFDILKHLVTHRGKVVSRDDLLDHVWGDEVIVSPRTIDTHVGNLRKKIEADPTQPKWIKSIRGTGYMFPAHES